MAHPINWRLLVGLTMFHLLLLPAVYFVPVWIGGHNAFSLRWSQIAHGSLNVAQYELLVVFWAISPWSWTKRTALFMTGLVVLSFVHVAIMFPLTKVHDSPTNLLWGLLLNTVDVFVGQALVLAVLLELLRPFWGTLRRITSEVPEQLTISALLRLTTLAALAAAVLQFSGSFLDDTVGFSIHLLLDAALLTSCVWMSFARRHAWVGIAGCLASVIAGILNTPAEIVAKHGPWHWLPSLCFTTFWICSTLLVVRYFGFRLQKHSQHRTATIPDRLLSENA